MSLSVISVPDTMMHCGNEMSCVLETSLPLSTPNLKILCYLNIEEVYDSGSYVVQPLQALDPDINGQCRFFWHEALKDSFERNYDVPDYQGNSEAKLQHHIKRYSLWAVERSGDPQATSDIITTGTLVDVRYAVNGGIAKIRFKQRPWFGALGWGLYTDMITGVAYKRFLDHRGYTVRTITTADQWLNFIWQDPGSVIGTTDMVLKVKYYLSDGTDATIDFLTVSSWAPYEGYMLPVGFTQLGLAAYETSSIKVTKYECWLYSAFGGGVVLSEVKTFKVDRDWYEWTHEFHYMNSLGTMCQVLLYGKPKDMVELDRHVAPQYWEQGYDGDQGESIQHDVDVMNGRGIASGYMSRQEHRLLIEMLASPKVLLVVDDVYMNNVPVRFTNKKWAQDGKANLLRVDLEYVVDYDDGVVDMIGMSAI